MTALILHRADPARNMRRFYQLDVQRDFSRSGALSANGDE
jgi:predicted DNA-binding WGR domain protein